MNEETITQEELEQLLAAVGEESFEHVPAAPEQPEKTHKIKLYDFKRPDRFNREQIRTIYMLHETFCRLWSGRLSNWLRTIVSMSVLSVDQVTYGEFLESIPSPSILAILAVEPLEGRALMEFSPSIAFPIIDRLLGGSGESQIQPRELTDIEERIISNIVDESLVFLREAWEAMVELEPELIRLEANPLFVQLVPPNDMVLVIAMETRLQAFSGLINLVYPYVLLEPILDKLTAQTLYSSQSPGTSPEVKQLIAESVRRAPVEVSVRVGRCELSFGDIMQLEEGDVIRLDSQMDDDLDIFVGGRLKFKGRPGIYRGRMACHITRLVKDEELEE